MPRAAAMTHPNAVEKLRNEAHGAYLEGHFQRALQLQVELINTNRASGQLSAQDFRFLALCFHAVDDHRQAYIAWREALGLEPDDAVAKANLALSAAKYGRNDEAVVIAEQAVNHRPDDANF